MKNDLQNRLFEFAVNIFNLLKNLPDNNGYRVYKYQLIKSSSSSGANYEESQAGSTKADFINKILISLKEMRESNYFLKLLYRTVDTQVDLDSIQMLITESEELKLILGSIVVRAKRNKKD